MQTENIQVSYIDDNLRLFCIFKSTDEDMKNERLQYNKKEKCYQWGQYSFTKEFTRKNSFFKKIKDICNRKVIYHAI